MEGSLGQDISGRGHFFQRGVETCRVNGTSATDARVSDGRRHLQLPIRGHRGGRRKVVDKDKCDECKICIEVCPVRAIVLE
jgi:NAD-dependent dihydropyrimidine dehydrogenase PreA subunit